MTTTRRLATLDPDGKLDTDQIPTSFASTHLHVYGETPAGTVNGTNPTFTLAGAPSPAGSLLLFRNGILMRPGAGNDFTLSTLTITFLASNFPQTGDILLASYTT